jgi:lipoate---protein ligase
MAGFDLTLPELAENLALDEALLIEADEGRAGAIVRLWEFPKYAVVLGASRKLRDDVHVDACRADGVQIARRTSGGGTVLLGPGALNVTVILSESAAPGLSAIDVAQHFVVERLAEAISQVGPRIGLQGLGDLTIGDWKCGGSAQRRLKKWFLVHCSLLYNFRLDLISRYLTIPSRQPAYRAGRGHAEFVRNLDVSRDSLTACMMSMVLPDVEGQAVPELPLDLVKTLVLEKFGNEAWTERF